MKPRYKIGTMVAVIPSSGACSDIPFYGTINKVICTKDKFAYVLDSGDNEWIESEVVMAYRPIPGSAKKKSRRKGNSIYRAKPDNQMELPLEGQVQ